jgi:hypothetical protein
VFPAVLFVLAVTGVALATPGLGIIEAPVQARGTNAERLNVHSKAGIKLQTKLSVDFVTQKIVIGPGGTTGWHSHPGPRARDDQVGRADARVRKRHVLPGAEYEAGESFVDRGDEMSHRRSTSGGKPRVLGDLPRAR